jgi:RNA polymerase sigma-70 factor (ECF subfamily)
VWVIFCNLAHDSLTHPLIELEELPLGSSEADATKPPDSFKAVVEAHWTAVYRLLYSLTGNPHDSEDLTQETFLRALRRWDTFKTGTNLRAWLLRIGTNAFFDVKRKSQTLKIGPLAEDVQSEELSPEVDLENKEQAALVRVALEDLSELTRLVFHLRVTEDLSFKEISELAEITEVAARQHMHQARTKLLKRFGERFGMKT